HRRDDGAVADGDDEGRPVDQDHGLAGALGGRALHGPVEAVEGLWRGVDAAALHALERVARELHAARALLEQLGERGALRRGGRARGREGRRADGWDEGRVVDRHAHATSTRLSVVMPDWPPIVSVGPFEPTSTRSTVPCT